MKVLYHIDEENKWEITLGNVKNMINTGKEIGEDFEIEVVANGVAILEYKRESKYYSEFKSLINNNVKFVSCNNSMKKNNIKKEDIYDLIEIVQSGVIEIAKKQQEGFSYIKP